MIGYLIEYRGVDTREEQTKGENSQCTKIRQGIYALELQTTWTLNPKRCKTQAKDASEKLNQKKAKRETWRRPSLSLVEFPSKSARSLHQLLELVLLHLRLATAPSADRMHGAVVAQALDVGHAGGRATRCVDGEAVVLACGVFHVAADEGTSGRLVGLATVGVAGFPDRQDR